MVAKVCLVVSNLLLGGCKGLLGDCYGVARWFLMCC